MPTSYSTESQQTTTYTTENQVSIGSTELVGQPIGLLLSLTYSVWNYTNENQVTTTYSLESQT